MVFRSQQGLVEVCFGLPESARVSRGLLRSTGVCRGVEVTPVDLGRPLHSPPDPFTTLQFPAEPSRTQTDPFRAQKTSADPRRPQQVNSLADFNRP